MKLISRLRAGGLGRKKLDIPAHHDLSRARWLGKQLASFAPRSGLQRALDSFAYAAKGDPKRFHRSLPVLVAKLGIELTQADMGAIVGCTGDRGGETTRAIQHYWLDRIDGDSGDQRR